MLGHAAARCDARHRGDPGGYDARSSGFAMKCASGGPRYSRSALSAAAMADDPGERRRGASGTRVTVTRKRPMARVQKYRIAKGTSVSIADTVAFESDDQR